MGPGMVTVDGGRVIVCPGSRMVAGGGAGSLTVTVGPGIVTQTTGGTQMSAACAGTVKNNDINPSRSPATIRFMLPA